MRAVVRVLAVVLAVPILCSVVSVSTRADWDRRWQAGLWRQFAQRRQPVNQRIIARLSLATLCADPRTAASVRPCRTYNACTAASSTSVAAGFLGLLLLAGLGAAGRAARARPAAASRLFGASLRATVVGVSLLAILHGGLAVAILYLRGEVTGRWPTFAVFGVALAVLLAVVSAIQATMAVARRTRISVVGRLLDPSSQPRLLQVMGDLAARLGSRTPAVVVAGSSPWLFVTEAEVMTLDGPARGGTVYCSLPLARILSVDEWRALVAHELAHFGGRDEESISRFYLSYTGVERAVRALERRATGLRSVVLRPVGWLLSFFLQRFAATAAAVSGEREAAADRAAAGVVGPAVLASALVKVHAFPPAWDTVRAAMDRAVAEGTQYANLSELFAEVVAHNSLPERLLGIGTRAVAHPTDRHAALGTRLARLGVNPPDVAASALMTRPEVPASALIEGLDGLERDLSEVEHRLVAHLRASDAGQAGTGRDKDEGAS